MSQSRFCFDVDEQTQLETALKNLGRLPTMRGKWDYLPTTRECNAPRSYAHNLIQQANDLLRDIDKQMGCELNSFRFDELMRVKRTVSAVANLRFI